MELLGIEKLKSKLSDKRLRVLTRYKYYDMKNICVDPGYVIPDRLKWMYKSSLGWCGKAVDSLADRLTFDKFDNDILGMNEIFRQNNPDILTDAAILGALISGCSFVYISLDENEEVRLQVIDGSDATGVIDPVTGLLKEGYAVLERDDNDNVLLEAYFEPYRTTYYCEDGTIEVVDSGIEYPLLVPVMYKPDSKRPFGHSRISRACMSLQDKACNVLTRADVTAEFYSFPQKWVSGTSPDSEPLDKWKASITSILEITKDADGDKPTFGQFVQQGMSPHVEMLRMYASAFCGETDLILDDLGFVSGNPSSYEAIKASHEKLRLVARKSQRKFGSCFLNVGFVASCLRDSESYKRNRVVDIVPTWYPIFEPDASTLSAIGDGANKINQAIPNYFGKNNLESLTGIRADS